jgi:hypothetical protein
MAAILFLQHLSSPNAHPDTWCISISVASFLTYVWLPGPAASSYHCLSPIFPFRPDTMGPALDQILTTCDLIYYIGLNQIPDLYFHPQSDIRAIFLRWN